jgi:hypothetical protein
MIMARRDFLMGRECARVSDNSLTWINSGPKAADR